MSEVSAPNTIGQTWPEQNAIDEWWHEHSLELKDAASRYRIECEACIAQLEQQLSAARGVVAMYYGSHNNRSEGDTRPPCKCTECRHARHVLDEPSNEQLAANPEEPDGDTNSTNETL